MKIHRRDITRRRGKSEWSSHEKRAWLALGTFAVLVALLGGASRATELQLVVLRPLSALFLLTAFWRPRLELPSEIRLLALLLCAFTGWVVLQLVPLPAFLWQGLPGRDVIAAIDAILGDEDLWRPISLAPSRTFNALLSLVVPVSAFLLAITYRSVNSGLLLLILLSALGVLDALIGLGQILTGRNSLLYFYEVTSRGSPVGIFANENHSAVFSSISLLVIARLGTDSVFRDLCRWGQIPCVAAYCVVLLAVLVGSSRAGLALTGLALVVSVLMVLIENRSYPFRAAPPQQVEAADLNRKIVFGALGGAIALVLLIYFLLERTPAFADILNKNAFEDLRARLWPVLVEMMSDFWVFGSGFGSFEAVYHIYEPTKLLIPKYVNQAHNDWAQIIIEGGIPATAMLLILLGWIWSSISKIIFGRFALPNLGLFWLAVFAILAASSVVDYPLRTPIFQVVSVWLLVLLAWDRKALQ